MVNVVIECPLTLLFKTSKAQGTKDPKEVANTLALDNIEKLVLQQTNEFLYHSSKVHSEKKSDIYADKNHNEQPLGIIMEQSRYFLSCRNYFWFAFVIGILIFLEKSDLVFEGTEGMDWLRNKESLMLK